MKKTRTSSLLDNAPNYLVECAIQKRIFLKAFQFHGILIFSSFFQIFVGGLKEDHTEDDIRQYFEEFGKIVAITRLTEKDTGKPRGFG